MKRDFWSWFFFIFILNRIINLTGLAYMLNLSIEQVITVIQKLDIPINSPDYILTKKDIKKIKKYVRRNNSSILKDTVVAAAAANITVTEVTNLTINQGGSLAKEDWINPFDPNYP